MSNQTPPAVGQTELERILNRYERRLRVLEVEHEVFGKAYSLQGAWNGTGTAAKTFTTPSGILRLQATCTAFSGSQTNIAVDVYVDGVQKFRMQLSVTHTVGAHVALPGAAVEVAVTQGSHTVDLRQAFGTSDNNDYGSLLVFVTPA